MIMIDRLVSNLISDLLPVLGLFINSFPKNKSFIECNSTNLLTTFTKGEEGELVMVPVLQVIIIDHDIQFLGELIS